MVVCRECGKSYKVLYVHLKRTHGMATEDYEKKHPESELISSESTAAYRNWYNSDRFRETQEERLRQLWSDPAHVQKMQAVLSKNAIELWHDPEFAARKAAAASARLKKWWSDPAYRLARSVAGTEAMKKLWGDPEFVSSFMDRHPKTYTYESSKVGTITVQSTYEEAACAFLDSDPRVSTYRRGPTLPYVGLDGQVHSTFVDFEVCRDGEVCLLEVKAIYYMLDPTTHLKLNAVSRYAHDAELGFWIWTELELGLTREAA